jgi:hypothetical protein
MSFEEWTEVSRKLKEEPVIEFVHGKDSEIAALIRKWFPTSWNVRDETNERLDGHVFLILGSYDLDLPGEERLQRRFVELWLYDRFSQKLTCRRQVVTNYPDIEGGLKEVPSPYLSKEREEIDLRNAAESSEGFLQILNQDIFRPKEERKSRQLDD